MLPSETLIARIRGEYREMPGLRLTIAQARRLWQLDMDTCTLVIQTLVEEGFLIARQDSTFIALPATGMPLKAVKTEPMPIHVRQSG